MHNLQNVLVLLTISLLLLVAVNFSLIGRKSLLRLFQTTAIMIAGILLYFAIVITGNCLK